MKDQIRNHPKQPEKPSQSNFDPKQFLSTGSTLLNLALTDHWNCGWQKGKMANIIGDSSSGKTFLTLTAYAEAARNKNFDDFEFIFDDAENANEFDMEYLFGEQVQERMQAPTAKDDGDVYSETMEDFHDNLLVSLKNGNPFLYVLDSFDSLTTEADDDKIEEQHKARMAGKEVKGTYGMTKAKKSSEILRHIVGKLKRSESMLLIISQTRDNIDPLSFEKKTRSGGKALKFYATYEMWLALGSPITSKDRSIGINCIIKVSKNKITGKRRKIEFPIFYDYGVDDLASCIDFLIKEGRWKKAKGASKIDPCGDLGLEPATAKSLINQIEEQGLEVKLKQLVGRVWNEIEESLKLRRKKKYD